MRVLYVSKTEIPDARKSRSGWMTDAVIDDEGRLIPASKDGFFILESKEFVDKNARRATLMCGLQGEPIKPRLFQRGFPIFSGKAIIEVEIENVGEIGYEIYINKYNIIRRVHKLYVVSAVLFHQIVKNDTVSKLCRDYTLVVKTAIEMLDEQAAINTGRMNHRDRMHYTLED